MSSTASEVAPEKPKFFRCENAEALGNLIRHWADGKGVGLPKTDANGKPLRFDKPNNHDFAEFKRQLAACGAGPIDLDEFKAVRIVSAPDDDTLVVPVPSAGQIARGKAFRKAHGAWLSPFYHNAYDGPPKPTVINDDVFAVQRLGEYCISHCC